MKGRLPKFGVFARRDNCMVIASRNFIVASACIVCAVHRNTPDLFAWCDLVEKVREHRRIFCPAGDCKAFCREGPMLLLEASIERISSVPSLISICILRQRRRFDPSCLRELHSPSPSTLTPVLSTARQSLLAAMRGDEQM